MFFLLFFSFVLSLLSPSSPFNSLHPVMPSICCSFYLAFIFFLLAPSILTRVLFSFLPSSFLSLSILSSFIPFTPSSISFCPSDCFSHTDTHVRHPNESLSLLILRVLSNVFAACSNRMFSKYLHSGSLSEMSVCMNTLPCETNTARLPAYRKD